MKGALKLPEPQTLADYRQAVPESNWEQMRNDALHGGQAAYRDIKRALVRGQRGLCGYCETTLATGLTDLEIDERKQDQRVEHFHPKSDPARPPNWNLHWPTMWAVCTGGDAWPPDGEPLDPTKHVYPRPENLCCDSFKNRQIEIGQLQEPPEGRILSPHEIPPFPRLFDYRPDGTPEPCVANCATVVIPGNLYPDTQSLVSETIRHLNLGCNRLNRNRSLLRSKLEKVIQQRREASPGQPAADVLLKLARQIFPNDVTKPWPEFFTFVRWRLGPAAETRLQEIGFTG